MAELTVAEAKQEKARRMCQRRFGAFFRATLPNKPYYFGHHTKDIIEVLQGIVDRLKAGECVYEAVSCPPRHGKSDLFSRRFPAWVLVQNPFWRVILCSYSQPLANGFSYDVRRCLTRVGPSLGVMIAAERRSVADWTVEPVRPERWEGALQREPGGVVPVGLGGTITGRGADVLIIDDPIKGRQEAESAVIREGVWSAFQSDLLTRLAPVHAVIIVNTRWHEDDLCGRIERQNNPLSDSYNSDFPVYNVHNYPAEYATDEDGKIQWLFPERFPSKWYETMRASVGDYSWASEFNGNPKPREGNFLKAENVQVVDKIPEGEIFWIRFWDLASTEKERAKKDPDFSVGAKLGLWEDEESMEHLFVSDLVRGRWGATKRNELIERTAEQDGEDVPVVIETVAGYKDAYEQVQNRIGERFQVEEFVPTKDKVSRASSVECFFDHKRIHIRRAPWNTAWKDEHLAFPRGKHDDQVDTTSGGYLYLRDSGSILVF